MMQQKSGFLTYDWFKLIVAVLLILLLLWLWFGRGLNSTAQSAETNTVHIPIVVGQDGVEQTEQTAVENTPTAQPSPTATMLPTLEVTPEPTQTPTQEPDPAATQVPTAEFTPTPEAVETSAAETTSAAACSLAAPSRIKVGERVRITSNLHLRTTPEIANNIQQTNLAGTVMEVIGGPVCTPYQGGAYLWWQVQLDSGVSGWSAEANSSGGFYFLEPVD